LPTLPYLPSCRRIRRIRRIRRVRFVSSAAACTLHPLSAPRHAERFKRRTRSCTSPLPVTLRPGLSGLGFHTCQIDVVGCWPLLVSKPPYMYLSCLLSFLLDSGFADCARWNARGWWGVWSVQYVCSLAWRKCLTWRCPSCLLLPQQLRSPEVLLAMPLLPEGLQVPVAGLLGSASSCRGCQIRGQAVDVLQIAAQLCPKGPADAS
jgi:hypothetical protein